MFYQKYTIEPYGDYGRYIVVFGMYAASDEDGTILFDSLGDAYDWIVAKVKEEGNDNNSTRATHRP